MFDLLKGKHTERLGRKASGLNPAERGKIAGLPGYENCNPLLLGSGFFVCNFTSKKGHGESSMQIDSSLSYRSPAVLLTSANQSSGARNNGILNSGKGDV